METLHSDMIGKVPYHLKKETFLHLGSWTEIGTNSVKVTIFLSQSLTAIRATHAFIEMVARSSFTKATIFDHFDYIPKIANGSDCQTLRHFNYGHFEHRNYAKSIKQTSNIKNNFS